MKSYPTRWWQHLIAYLIMLASLIYLAKYVHAQSDGSHAHFVWIQNIGRLQRVSKVNVDGRCYLIFSEYSQNGNSAVGISTQPAVCQ